MESLDDKEVEYETEEFNRPLHSLTQDGLKLNDVLNGVEFEHDMTKDEEEAKEDGSWWSKDELLHHIEIHNQDQAKEDFLIPFEEKILKFDSLTEDDGVYKKILKHGTGPVILENNSIGYHCTAYLDGVDEPFDSTVLRARPFLHRLSSDTIIWGLRTGLLTMKKHEKAEIIVRPQYGFGDLGCPPRIPRDATILYVVEILNIFEEGTLASFETLHTEEQSRFTFKDVLDMCNQERISGNTYFSDGRYKESAFRYKKAIKVLERYTYSNADQNENANETLLKLYCNVANAYNKIPMPLSAMFYCKRALVIDTNNLKALYHYGMAKFINGDYDRCRELLMKAKRIYPKNSSVDVLLKKLDSRLRLENIQEKDLYSKMGKVFKN